MEAIVCGLPEKAKGFSESRLRVLPESGRTFILDEDVITRMPEPALQDVIRSSPVIVHKGRYAYLRGAEKELKGHFLVAQDKDETTIVTEEANLAGTDYEKAVTWFRLLEFRVSVPFLAPGFLAEISGAVAKKGLNILIVSTFSKDYALVQEGDLDQALKALEGIGFSIRDGVNRNHPAK